MSNMIYISVIERYHEFKAAIEQMLISILSGVNEEPMFHNHKTQCKVIGDIAESYPFLDMLYILDEKGIQISDSRLVDRLRNICVLGSESRKHVDTNA